MDTRIDGKRVYDTLVKIVEEHGEGYVYHRSRAAYYFANGQPDCLVGHVVDRLGLEVLKSVLEMLPNTSMISDRIHPYFAQRFTPHAVSMLRVIQFHQDRGASWGACRDLAHTVLCQHVTNWGDDR